MSKKHKKVCTSLNYIKQCLILASKITGCDSIFAFASLLGIAGVKKYKSIIKKKKKGMLKQYCCQNQVLISKALIESNISHYEFVLINNVLNEYEKMKEATKNLKT